MRRHRAIVAMTGLVLFASACGASSPRTSSPQQSAVSFSCRLPIGSEGGDFGGFVSFPQATFERASKSSLTYDAAPQRWLPALRQMLSPDGQSYVYAQDTKVPPRAASHAVDIANSQDRLVRTAPSAPRLPWWP